MSNTKATGVAYLDPEFTTCYASEEIGYALAGQGAVTQETSKSTGVTLNTSMGRITTNGATLNTLTNVTFTLTNSLISVKDVIILNVSSGATSGAYNCWISSMSVKAEVAAGKPVKQAVAIAYSVKREAEKKKK